MTFTVGLDRKNMGKRKENGRRNAMERNKEEWKGN